MFVLAAVVEHCLSCSTLIIYCRTEGQYTLQFMFDCDVDCSFTVMQGLPDSVTLSQLNKE